MSENDVVVWSKDSFLSWSDFKAEANPSVYEDSHSYIKYHYTWVVNSDKMGKDIFFFIENIHLSVEFHKVLSWVRISESTPDLLKHEQGHFDLAELVKRQNIDQIQSKFQDKHYPTRGQNEDQRKQNAKEDSGKMITTEVEKLHAILSKMRTEYDDETEFGHNQEMQSKYNKIFENLRV